MHSTYETTVIIRVNVFASYPFYSIEICSGHDLQDFYIKVGPYHEQFGSCGGENNTLPRASQKAFVCNPNAKGATLEILLLGNLEQYITLCEVVVYGKGKVWGA